MANIAASLTSQQSGTSAATPKVNQQVDVQCRKCGKKNHSTACCCMLLPSHPEPKCTFCGKGKHSMENCKARKKAEKKLEKELRVNRTPTVVSTAMSTTSLGSTTHHRPNLHRVISKCQWSRRTMQQVLLQTAGIEERLQHLANRVNPINCIRIVAAFSSTPCLYICMK